MKREYWLLVAFAFWSFFCVWWYLFDLREITGSPAGTNPDDNLRSVLEIMVIILTCTLLGFAMGWTINHSKLQNLKSKTSKLAKQKHTLLEGRLSLKSQLRVQRQQLGALHIFFEKQNVQAQQELHRLQSLLSKEDAAGDQNTEQQEELANRLKNLEQANRELELRNRELKATLFQIGAKGSSLASARASHPFVKGPPTRRDDLTKIKGIGPFIEKRLNMLGIYSYEQLSKLSSDELEQVSRAIEFFPQRIAKDDWAGQARRLL